MFLSNSTMNLSCYNEVDLSLSIPLFQLELSARYLPIFFKKSFIGTLIIAIMLKNKDES